MFQNVRKKPVVVQAMQWDGTPEGVMGIIGSAQTWLSLHNAQSMFEFSDGELVIKTLEDGSLGQAKHVASPGDYIIRGVSGEFYACKPSIFQETYEIVDQ